MSVKLTVVWSMPLAQTLLDRLHEENIAAFSSVERDVGELHFGGSLSIGVWIRDRADAGRALKIVREILGGPAPIACPQCGYDLRGHAGSTRCPECGIPIDLSESGPSPAPDDAETVCPTCGEPVPRHFEICWSCGAEVDR